MYLNGVTLAAARVAREGGELGPRGSNRGHERWLDSGCILKVAWVEFPCRWDIQCKRKRGVKKYSRIFVASYWEDGVAMK